MQGVLPTKIYIRLRRIYIALFTNSNSFLKSNYDEDGLISDHVNEFIDNEFFTAAYDFGNTDFNGSETKMNYGIRYRAYVALWCAIEASQKSPKSTFIELGVGNGVLFGTIAKYFSLTNLVLNKVFLFDTFSGIPVQKSDSSELSLVHALNRRFYNTDYYSKICKKFRDFTQIEIVKGVLPDSLEILKKSEVTIGFCSVDLNNSNSELESIACLTPMLRDGAIILLDDYAYSLDYTLQRKAWDLWAKDNHQNILCLPTGQGLIFFRK